MRKRAEVAEHDVEIAKEEVDRKPVSGPAELPKGRVQFGNANAATEKDLSDDFEQIVTSIFVEKPWEEYQHLERALKIGQTRSDHGSVNKHLDNAEANARRAHRLWMTAKVERERWERGNATVFAAMRGEATKVLQREKDQGLRSKQITDADVDSQCAALYPDEWMHQEIKRKQVKAMEDSMQNLAEMWNSRCRSLQAMLSKLR